MNPASPFPIDSSSPTEAAQPPATPSQSQAAQRLASRRRQNPVPHAVPTSYGAGDSYAIPHHPYPPQSDWHRSRFSSLPQYLTVEPFHLYDSRIETKSFLRTHLPVAAHLLSSNSIQ